MPMNAAMRHISVNFIRPSADRTAGFAALTESTWLLENAEHLRRVHARSKDKLNILLVGQVDAIPENVLESLRSSCVVQDATQAYDALAAEFPQVMNRFGGPYSTFGFGFLRWLLIDRVFPGEPVLCYDGDVVHNVALDELAQAFQGITRTATSTCFASVADPEWFRAWRQHLGRLNSDFAGFMDRYLPGLTYGFDQMRSSPEEYFAKFLIEAGELPHQELDDAFPYWIVPQPQTLPRLFNFVRIKGVERIPTPMHYTRTEGIDRINGRPVAFWHLQKPFMSQLSALAILSRSPPTTVPGAIPPLIFYGNRPSASDYLMNDPYHHLGGTPTVPWNLYGFAHWLLKQQQSLRDARGRPADNPFHPAFLYDFYFRSHDFSPIFNRARWPIADAWAT